MTKWNGGQTTTRIVGKQWRRIIGGGPAKGKKETYKRFSVTNKLFIKACELAGIPSTRRQASKWHMERGLAYNMKGQVIQAVVQ